MEKTKFSPFFCAQDFSVPTLLRSIPFDNHPVHPRAMFARTAGRTDKQTENQGKHHHSMCDEDFSYHSTRKNVHKNIHVYSDRKPQDY